MSSTTITSEDTNPLVARLQRDGFVLIPSILPPTQLSSLRAAAAHVTSVSRRGGWPHIRTVGKQFPPWPASPPPSGIWGVQSLLHPALPIPAPERAAFAQLYFSEAVLAPTRALLGGCRDEDLVLELLNLLVRPGASDDPAGARDEEDFELRWHRDDIPATATAEEEMARLGEPAWHAQWNLALYDDDSLVVVPGSQARPRTAAERAADPYAPEADVAGAVRVRLRAGDMAFYNNNILHKGVYSAKKERLTLHGSVGHVSGSRARARNVLQHGVGQWVDGCDFSCLEEGPERARAEGMRERLVKMGRESGDVGFSLTE